MVSLSVVTRRTFWRFAPAVAVFCLLPTAAIAQPLFGLGLSASTLGPGIQGAVSVTGISNLRAGFNAFDYSNSLNKDGVHYEGTLKLRSVQVTWDQYFHGTGGFHVSPGLLIYDGNSGTASANVPAGQTFTLGGTTYYSNAANPVTGSGAVSVRKASPMVLLGFGNLLPRSQRHFGISVEAGVVFQGSPNAKISLSGSGCLVNATTGCLNAATDPTIQANLQAEQIKLNNELNPFRYYPVAALGFSYKF